MARMSNRSKNTSRIRHLVGFSVLIILLFSMLVVYQGASGYRTAIASGEQNAKRLAHIMADHVEVTFLGADLMLRRATTELKQHQGGGEDALVKTMEQNFRNWLNETPQIVGIAVVAAGGDVKVAAHRRNFERWLDYSKGLVDQRLFESMQQADDRSVFLGRVESGIGRPLILMSRRYSLQGGAFGGIILTVIDPNYFVNFYNSVADGKLKYMALTLSDGLALASGPMKDPASDQLVARMAGKMIAAQKDEIPEVKTLITSISGTIKIIASLGFAHLPGAIHVVQDEKDVLSEWRASRARDVGFLVLFTVFGSVISFFAIAMARQIMRAEESEEAAILASQAKSEFLANMSHELRTPLNAIIGFSEMINSGYFGPLTPKQKERIHDINLCGSHLLQLISDILEFSKGDAGKLELAEERVNLLEIIDETERMLSVKMKAKQITFATRREMDGRLLWADKRKIRQVLINLVSNALKFTPEGGRITVAAQVDAQGGIVLTVEDTGIGIPEEDIPRALSVFGQVHRNSSQEGTGLGLPLCKMYAELHGGKLTLTSKVNEGTKVKITFPPTRTMK